MIRVIGEVGKSPGQFVYPRCLDSDGVSLWVIDKAARVQRLDLETGACLASWTMPEHVLGKPTGVTAGPGPGGVPAIYVADTHYQRVVVYAIPQSIDEPARELARFGSYGRGPGQFIYPTDVAVLAGDDGSVNRLYVSEYGGNDRVSVFDGSYRFLFSFGSPDAEAEIVIAGGDEPGAEAPTPGEILFNRPQSLALDARRGRLIVADACAHRLGVFDLDGRLQRWIGSRGEVGRVPGQFNYPYGLALADDGTVLVAEFGNSRIQRIDPETGRSLGVYGVVGRGDGELLAPWAVAIAGSTAYVLDSGNNRVIAFPAPARRRLAAGDRR